MNEKEPTGVNDDALQFVQKQFINHTPELRAFLSALVIDSHLVDDLMHAVFLTVTTNASSFDQSREFLPWLRTIAKNKAIDAAREAGRGPQVLAPDVIETMAESVPSLAPAAADVEHLALCIEELAPRARTAITLRYYESLKPPEIARRMSLAVQSVNVTLSRARASLRDCLARKSRRQRM